jgi:hypothetical protein
MSNLIVTTNIEQLLDGWIEAERNGVQFPVPLHDYWNIAGHRYKKNAFDLAESLLQEGLDFSLPPKVRSESGRKQKAMMLTVAALEHLCMAAHTQQGRDVRELYRQAKAKWDIVQKIAPEVAAEAELMHLKIELAKIEAQKEVAIASGKQADLQLVQFRHIVTSTMPEHVQQKILGYQVVEKAVTVDRVIHDDDLVRDGSTVNKTALCKRLNFLTKNGKPDHKRLNDFLVACHLPESAWQLTVSLQDNLELTAEAAEEVERRWFATMDRDRYIGE